MLKSLIVGFAFLLLAPSLYANDFANFKNSLKVSMEVSGFYWDEHYHGEKLLDETGTIYGIGTIFKGFSKKRTDSENDIHRLSYGGQAKIYLGTVDYDGQTQMGDPVETEVDYIGFNLEGNIGTVIKAGTAQLFIEPEFSLGVSTWSRDLNSTSDATGYIENWSNLYSRLGLSFIFPLNIHTKLKFSGGINLPIWVENRVDLYGTEDLELSPEPFHPSPSFTVNFDYKRFGITIYYDSFLFGKSDIEYLDNVGYLQPESHTYNAGVRFSVIVF